MELLQTTVAGLTSAERWHPSLGGVGQPGRGTQSADMARPAAALLLALITVLVVHNSDAILCYVCSSDVDRSCGDPFNTTSRRFLVSDCERDRSHTPYLTVKPVCRKFSHMLGDQLVVVRSCAWGSDNDIDGPCSPATLSYAKKIESCSTCTTDVCNSAPKFGIMSTLIALPVALLTARHM